MYSSQKKQQNPANCHLWPAVDRRRPATSYWRRQCVLNSGEVDGNPNLYGVNAICICYVKKVLLFFVKWYSIVMFCKYGIRFVYFGNSPKLNLGKTVNFVHLGQNSD